MMIFKRDTGDSVEHQPINTWRLSEGSNDILHPVIRDSKGDWFGLETHSISSDGTVSPSVVCPYGCGFHEFVKLEGWDQIEGRKQT